jgi:hypothetical protein
MATEYEAAVVETKNAMVSPRAALSGWQYPAMDMEITCFSWGRTCD